MPQPWFRMYAKGRHDSKIRMLDPCDRWYFVAVLMLKCDGELDKPDSGLREKEIAVQLELTLEEAKEIKKKLVELQLIDENWQPLAWDKLQYKSDFSKNRTKKYRGKTTTSQNVTASDRHSDGHVTPPDTDTDTDTDSEYRGSSKPRTNEFSSVKKISSSSRENHENEHHSRIHAKSRKTDTGANGKQNDTFQDSRLLNFERILRRYHQHLPDLHSVRSISIERQALMDSLVAGPLPNLGDWSDYFRRVGRSDFLMGRKVNGKKPFRASFNWLLRPEVVESVMEGKYDN